MICFLVKEMDQLALFISEKHYFMLIEIPAVVRLKNGQASTHSWLSGMCQFYTWATFDQRIPPLPAHDKIGLLACDLLLVA